MDPITGTPVVIDCVAGDDAAGCAGIEQWLSQRTDASPFHRPAWVNGVARGCGQQALFLLARGGRDAGAGTGAIHGLLPLNIIHSPLFGRALVSAGFAVDGGVLADDPVIAALLGDAAFGLAASLSCSTVELRGGTHPGEGWTVRSGAYLNFARPLGESADADLKAIPKRHRAEVRKGLENGFDLDVGRDERMRATHYALYRRSVHNLGSPVFPRALFDAVLNAFGEDAEIVTVSDRGQALSSVITLYHRGACMPYWHGADLNARRSRSNEVLYFRLMDHARGRGCTIFDFGRSKVGTGPALWKKTWGFDPEPLDYYVRALPGSEARDINPLSPQYQRKVALWKMLPAPIVDRLGPWIARGLG